MDLCNKPAEIPTTLNVKITELVLTPLSCASLVNEVLKSLLYQKNQIPYPYSWLKNVVEKKRSKDKTEDSTKKKRNLTAENHYRTVSTAYDSLEDIAKNIEKEFAVVDNSVKEIMVVIGTTPQCPKEVLVLNTCSLATGHHEKHHLRDSSKQQHKILRNIFLSQIWMDSMDWSTGCSNTYVYIKKPSTDVAVHSKDSPFIPVKPLVLPSKVKKLQLNFDYDNSKIVNCCDSMKVFGDVAEGKKNLPQKSDKDKGELVKEVWYQYKGVIKGFKDCFVNDVPACELW